MKPIREMTRYTEQTTSRDCIMLHTNRNRIFGTTTFFLSTAPTERRWLDWAAKAVCYEFCVKSQTTCFLHTVSREGGRMKSRDTERGEGAVKLPSAPHTCGCLPNLVWHVRNFFAGVWRILLFRFHFLLFEGWEGGVVVWVKFVIGCDHHRNERDATSPLLVSPTSLFVFFCRGSFEWMGVLGCTV